jgi:putative peptidoglycan lipid II flippase
MSDLYNQKDLDGFKNVIAKTTIQILYFIIPLSVFMLILRAQIVRLIYGGGQGTNFTFADTRAVAAILGFFVISLFAQSLIHLFTRAFYAMQNTKIPVIVSFLTIGVNIIVTYFLAHKYGVPGLAMAFSVTSIFEVAILMMELHFKLGSIHDEYLIVSSIKIMISSLLAGVATYVSLYMIAPFVNMHKYLGVFTQGVSAGLIGCAVYLAVSWVLGLQETHNLVAVTRNAVSKLGKPFAYVWSMWS